MKPARILLVEDETDMAAIVIDYLRHAGYEVEHIRHGREALDRMLRSPPDLTVLDIMLPGLDGLDILRQFRPHSASPVILLTARVEEMDRLLGLELGADDYICKPFAPREVVARVKAVLRRSAGPGPAQQRLTLLPEQGRAMLNGSVLPLTKRELTLLQALMRQPGRLYSRAQLLELACADTLDVNERAIDSHIKNLRKKLKAADDRHEWIRSVYGVGFAFEPDGGADTRAQ
ncbi:DNA-binding response regulator [Delftia acidovorans]|uniref:response regulator n=1 Tax=Delftia acidovorans TaxID=80866 RepID=UPI000BC342FF|nr:response regulator [Delftia acidovorans]ATH14994.1 DNA-binding response regulator [Delftia acidovorans]